MGIIRCSEAELIKIVFIMKSVVDKERKDEGSLPIATAPH